ncbi:magnetosome protein MamC [Desulfovibrio sp. JC010]|uniref:magnetosome protein MamC n=1 Tax=Desulfovibrio sp. JC010 TaxID=2593641 RepID=UPI0013D1DBF0|nr:magnetosome protein MamC [Desulfovibrio sp. JC010]NDV28545.1 hypothetical protein [Desulfovibrio sp. JC010]
MAVDSRVLLPAAVSASGTVGAVVGATVAAAKDIKRISDGEMTKSEAAADIGKEAVGTGLSTAAGVAVTGILGLTGLLGVVSIVGVAAGTKHLWDKKFAFKPEPNAEEVSA